MRLPDPLLVWKVTEARYANRQSGQVENLVLVGSIPTLATATVDFRFLICDFRLNRKSACLITNHKSARSRRPTATTPGLHPGDGGSTPSGITGC